MAKKTRTELSTLAINTNLPDNTQELITPTTERAQLTDERESVVNYKDDLGGAPNAGKFLTVAVDGESLTMVDAPTGDVTGTGEAFKIAFWFDTKVITFDTALFFNTNNNRLTAAQFEATLKVISAAYEAAVGSSMTFATGETGDPSPTTRLTISSGGNVLVGLANPATNVGKFEVETASAIAYTPTANITGTNLRLATGGTAGTNVTTGISMGIGGNAEAYIGAVQNSSGYADIVFQSFNGSYSEKMRISSGGLATFSNGIQFGTGDTLDAYEESTWTPSVAGTAIPSTNLFGVSYTLIGNVCNFQLYLLIPSGHIPSNSTHFQITLPLNVKGSNAFSGGNIATTGLFDSSAWNMMIFTNTNYMKFVNAATGVEKTNADATGMNGRSIIMSGTYFVA